MTRWAILCLVGVAGCKKPATIDEHAQPAPVDHLAPEEVVAGTEKAYALPLPRDSQIMVRVANEIHIQSSLEPELVSNFVRAHVKAGKAIVGSTMTTFEHVVVPEEPTRVLTIEIRRTNLPGGRTTMLIRDDTPAVPAAMPTDEAWRRAGRTTDGTLLDPKKVE